MKFFNKKSTNKPYENIMQIDAHMQEKEFLHRNFRYKGFMQLGSWGLSVYASKKYYIDTLAYLFKQNVNSVFEKKEINAFLHMIECKKDSGVFSPDLPIPDNSIASWEYLENGVATLFTGRFRIFIFKWETPVKIVIYIREPQYSHTAFVDHLFEVIHKILFMFGRFYIHAAAVKWNSRISAFVGDRGGGKSTVCLKLAQEGAQIISDDHIMFKKTINGFYASGCEETCRVTKKTEKGILGRLLSQKPANYNGVLKKEILLKDFFDCVHYKDFPIHDIFFIHIGDDFQISPISKQQAVINFIEKTKAFFRFNRFEDLNDYLAYFSQLVNQTRVFKLTLSHNLEDLNKLVTFLK